MRPAQAWQAAALEATMAYRANPAAFGGVTPVRPAQRQQTARPWRLRDLWRGLVDAVMTAHQKDAQREIDRLVARRGKMSDGLEREIEQRMMGQRWNVGP
jgi:hypothetical protein